TADASGPRHLRMTISRSRFDELIAPFLDRIRQPISQALSDANLSPSEIDEVVLVGGSTRVPRVLELVREYFGKEPHQRVNPDEVVAIGAAIQGSVLAGERDDVLLLDVTPLSLGIETLGGVLTKLVERNTTVPVEKHEVFSTAENGQTGVTVRVFQGERPMAADNRLLGAFNLEGLPPAPRGVPQIEVTFDIDHNGILNVRAKEKATGKEASVRIEDSAGLSDTDIRRMHQEAEQYAHKDKRRRELADLRNQADHECFQLEKLMDEHAAQLPESDREPLHRSIDQVRAAARGQEVQAIKSALQGLKRAGQALRQLLERQAQPRGGTAGGAPGGDTNNASGASSTSAAVNSAVRNRDRTA
ncbi:MAG: Hsp70 family protein, partial [Planctomycetota bacterium]